MVENSKIEWTDHTFCPWYGCQKIGPGCDHCYAEDLDLRQGFTGDGVRWGPKAERQLAAKPNWDRVVTWNHKAGERGVREKVFVASRADVFDNHKSILLEWRMRLAELVLACPNLDFLFLTKRAGNVGPLLKVMFPEGSPDNLWIGLTVVTQKEAERDLPDLLAAKADLGIKRVFLSMEPLIERVNLTALGTEGSTRPATLNALTGETTLNGRSVPLPAIDWVIVGGETGKDARPMHIDWVRDLRDQCEAAGTPFLFKQWGNWFPFGEKDADGLVNTTSNGKRPGEWHEWDEEAGFSVYMDKVKAGRFLDGRTWNGYPDQT